MVDIWGLSFIFVISVCVFTQIFTSLITAKFKSSGIGFLILTGFLFAVSCAMIFVLCHAIKIYDPNLSNGGITPAQSALFIILFGLVTFAIVFLLNKFAFRIAIDPVANTILFKRILSRTPTVYGFDEFDGLLETFAVTRSGRYKILYLIKDGKAAKIVTGLYYENIDELQAALSPLKYLGFEKNFKRLAARSLFNRSLMD